MIVEYLLGVRQMNTPVGYVRPMDIPTGEERKVREALAKVRSGEWVKPPMESNHHSMPETSFLGHTGGAGKVDHLLLFGATHEELNWARATYVDHLKHLRETHHLNVKKISGKSYFDIKD